ncbi:hypothetical protein N824_13600 [Pedobacter sp. V48]|nr:hypothetical protein N824_13600 [Pedobacter sp. V48]
MSIFQKIKNRIGLKRWIQNQNYIGSKVIIGKNTIVKASFLSGEISIGNNCKIYGASLNGRIQIGDFTSIWGPNIDINSSINSIRIGKFCSIAKNVTFQEFNHDHTKFTTFFIHKNILKDESFGADIVSKGEIIIENDVWIGAHSVILSGAHVSTGSVIAANSVVTGFVPPYSIVGGTPAKIIKSRFSPDVCEKLLESKWWDLSFDELKSNIAHLEKIVGN